MQVIAPDAGMRTLLERFPVLAEQAQIEEVCRRHHIRKLSLFGSALRDDFGPDSDVDVLITFEPGLTPDFVELYALETELSVLLSGYPIDLVTEAALNRHLRTSVLGSARVVYEQP